MINKKIGHPSTLQLHYKIIVHKLLGNVKGLLRKCEKNLMGACYVHNEQTARVHCSGGSGIFPSVSDKLFLWAVHRGAHHGPVCSPSN